MEVFTFAALAALASKVTSTIKLATSGQHRAALAQVVTWASGVAALAVGAAADFTAALGPELGLPALGTWDWASLVLGGLALGSSGSFAYDLRRALDNGDTAEEPPLGGPPM